MHRLNYSLSLTIKILYSDENDWQNINCQDLGSQISKISFNKRNGMGKSIWNQNINILLQCIEIIIIIIIQLFSYSIPLSSVLCYANPVQRVGGVSLLLLFSCSRILHSSNRFVQHHLSFKTMVITSSASVLLRRSPFLIWSPRHTQHKKNPSFRISAGMGVEFGCRRNVSTMRRQCQQCPKCQYCVDNNSVFSYKLQLTTPVVLTHQHMSI